MEVKYHLGNVCHAEFWFPTEGLGLKGKITEYAGPWPILVRSITLFVHYWLECV